MTLQSSTLPPLNKCFDRGHSHDHPMDCQQAATPATSGRSHISDGSPLEVMALHWKTQMSCFNNKSPCMQTKKATNQERLQPMRMTSSNGKIATNRIATTGIKMEIADLPPLI
uniref:Uncharacterized protein n=1 Tax=Romanomermis culicivorax TaxID=13658 RepID=A0A915INB1_ROMCU